MAMINYTQPGFKPYMVGYNKAGDPDKKNFGYPPKYYYAGTTRALLTAFGNFFNDIYIGRRNQYQEVEKWVRVPIKYGPRKKSHDFRTEQETGEPAYISLPNITYKLDGISYAADRDSGVYETRAFYNDVLTDAGIEYEMEEQFWSDVQPAPINLNITMEINCEDIDDLNDIGEQIIPRFRPAAFLAVKEFWFFNKRRSIKLRMNDPGIQIDNDAMGEEDRREVKGTITFTIEAVFYLPIKTAQIITKINTFLQADKTAGALWHAQAFGNPNGTLTQPHEFSNVYDTLVTSAYVLSGQPVTSWDEETMTSTTEYFYTRTEQLTTYNADAKLLVKETKQWSPSADPVYTIEELYDDKNFCYYTSSVPHYDEWIITKEYMSVSGFGDNQDDTIKFGNKTMYDKYFRPFSAYYSTYTEEGTVSGMNFKFDPASQEVTYSGKYDKSEPKPFIKN